MNTVAVDLGARSYEVRIGSGLIARAGAEIAPLLRRKRVAIVTDATVAALHLPALQTALEAAGIASAALALPAGEATCFRSASTNCWRLARWSRPQH